MLTTTIAVIALVLLITLIISIVNEDDDGIRTLQMVSTIIIIVLGVFSIIEVNSDTKKYASKTKVTPTVEINITKLDGLVTKSDTTYIYTFRE